jgi:glycosyltransferase involved in cell wall biosynthesis
MFASMNILYVNYVESNEGLGTLDVFVPFKELARRGNKVVLVSINDGTKQYKLEVQKGGELEVYPIIPVKFRPLKSQMLLVILTYLCSPLLLIKLVRIIDKNSSQVLLSCSDYSLPIISFLLSRLRKIPLVLIHREMHLEAFYLFSDHSFLIKYTAWFLAKINQFFYRRVKHSVAISKSIEVFLCNGLHLNNIRTINLLCVDPQEFDSIKRLITSGENLPRSKELVVLYSGSLSRLRRTDVLIEAFIEISRKYPNVRLVISGNPTFAERMYLETSLNKEIVGRLSFKGFLPRRDLLHLMLRSEVCVDPSPVKSWNPSGKIAEYMAAERCVITSDTFTHRFFIKNGVNGLLFRPNNVKDLVDKLDLVLGDPELREKLGAEARKTIEKEFDVREVGQIFQSFLEDFTRALKCIRNKRARFQCSKRFTKK